MPPRSAHTSPGPKDRLVDESWPTNGIQSSFYSRHKVAVERELDRVERDDPEIRVVRMRPGLILKAQAATEIRRCSRDRSSRGLCCGPD